MTNEQARVLTWMKAFGQDCPTQPTIPSLEIRKLRAKLILEEALETIKGLGMTVTLKNGDQFWYEDLDIRVFDNATPNLIDIIDGCEDLKVVTEGTLVACGICQEGLLGERHCKEDEHFNEVMRANEGKLWSDDEVSAKTSYEGEDSCFEDNGLTFEETRIEGKQFWLVKDESGKIIKPPSFTPPNHHGILQDRFYNKTGID